MYVCVLASHWHFRCQSETKNQTTKKTHTDSPTNFEPVEWVKLERIHGKKHRFSIWLHLSSFAAFKWNKQKIYNIYTIFINIHTISSIHIEMYRFVSVSLSVCLLLFLLLNSFSFFSCLLSLKTIDFIVKTPFNMCIWALYIGYLCA